MAVLQPVAAADTILGDMSSSDRPPLGEARLALAAAYRLADREGLNEGINNHFTLRVEPVAGGEEDRFLVIPHGRHWKEVTASSLLLVDGDGDLLEGEGEVEASAFFIHSRILKARPDVNAVLHTHMSYATALTLLEEGRLLPVSQNALRFHGRVAYLDDYRGAADNSEEGSALAGALGDKDVLFHASHGVVVVGPTIAKAFDDLYFLERAAKVQLLAQATGKPLRRIPDAVADTYVRPDRPNHLGLQADLHFRALRRLLDRETPDYRE